MPRRLSWDSTGTSTILLPHLVVNVINVACLLASVTMWRAQSLGPVRLLSWLPSVINQMHRTMMRHLATEMTEIQLFDCTAWYDTRQHLPHFKKTFVCLDLESFGRVVYQVNLYGILQHTFRHTKRA